jgi:hypothetical protein
MPKLTRQPKLVLTARRDRPRLANNLVNDVVNCILGRSSDITQQVRTHDKLTPRA